MRRTFLYGLLLSPLAACAAATAGPQAFTGEWEWHFETSAFRALDGRGPWWLAAEGSTWDQIVAPIQRAGGGPWGRVALTVEGELSAPGRYGHLGAYERELRVTRVIEARLMSASRPPSGS